MVRFESALYADPDGSLDDLWWALVERHQGLRRPEGRTGEDWATKIHIVSSPVYYHNYMLGELLASQMWRAISEHLALGPGAEGRLVGHLEAGRFFEDRVFAGGASLAWPEHVESATGRPLSVEDYATQYG